MKRSEKEQVKRVKEVKKVETEEQVILSHYYFYSCFFRRTIGSIYKFDLFINF